MAKRIVGYVRCSTNGQSDDGHSIDTQLDQLRTYAHLYNIELVAVYCDEGYTGKNLDRPDLKKALEAITSGEAEGMLVAKLDRLSRNVKDLATLLDVVFQDAELHSVNEKLDTGTPHGRLAINIISSVGQWEAEVISQRTKATLTSLKKAGKYYGGRAPKYGYKVTNDNNLQRDNFEMKVIRKAKKLRAKGFSYRAIASQLASSGMSNRQGKVFHAQQVKSMVA